MSHITRRSSFVLVLLAAVAASWALADSAPGGSERRERGALVIEGIPEIPQRLSEELLPYQNTRSARLLDWDRGGKGILISTRFGETVQVHTVARPGGARRQLTFFQEPISTAAACPDPKARGFLFAKDVGGGENFQIYFYDLARGGVTLLTDGTSRNTGPVWSNRGDRFAWASNRHNGRDMGLYVAERAHAGEALAVLEKEGTWNVLDWSPDDARLLVIREVSINETYLHTIDLATGKLTPVHPKDEPIGYQTALFSRDGRGIYLTSDEGSEFQRLRYYDLGTGRMTDLTADIPWDVEQIALTRRGDRLAFTVNEKGVSRLYLLDTKTRARTPVTSVPDGVMGDLRFDPAGARLGLSLESATSPNDVYVLDLAKRGLERWTESEVGGLDPASFIAPELIEYPTFDEAAGRPRLIQAFYYRPAKPVGRTPVLISIHGGPEAQYRPVFSAMTQYEVGRLGLAILAPNVRGSAGYGKSFLKLDNADLRDDSVKDIGALLDWIATRPELDPARVGVVGGSYGGYMSLACMTHFGDRLKAGIDVVGISNFVSFLGNTSGYRQDLRRVEYGDERDPKMREYLARISPLNQVDRIRSPILIVQGQNDPRVPVSESEQMLAAIKKNGVAPWYLMAKDEGHGFRKKSNVDFFTSAVALFLETQLAVAPSSTPPPAR